VPEYPVKSTFLNSLPVEIVKADAPAFTVRFGAFDVVPPAVEPN